MKKPAVLEANHKGELYRKLKEPMFEKVKSQMNMTSYRLEHYNSIPKEYEEILYQGISSNAFDAKELAPIYPFSIFIKDQEENVLGGVSGTLFYGSLYVDSLWVNKALRHQGWGSRLMQEAEKFGREHGARFVTLNTMDWEARSFYEKLGYSIEFTREGYEKDSKMFMLRKNL